MSPRKKNPQKDIAGDASERQDDAGKASKQKAGEEKAVGRTRAQRKGRKTESRAKPGPPAAKGRTSPAVKKVKSGTASGDAASAEDARSSVPPARQGAPPTAESTAGEPMADAAAYMTPACEATPPDPEAEDEPDSSGCWSPGDYPRLEICWSSTDGEAFFTVTVALGSAVFVDTVLSAENPLVPFSLRDDTAPDPFIEGTLSYEAKPSILPPVLLSVEELKFPGGYVAESVLFPQE